MGEPAESNVGGAEAFGRAVDALEAAISRYGIALVRRDIPDPLTGDLNGAEIHIDIAVTPEQHVFLLAHLFGHTVQWNTDPGAYELGRPQRPPVAAEQLPRLLEYELEAARYGLQLLRECGLDGFDQWFSDYSACDRAYLESFYRSGRRHAFAAFWKHGAEPLHPVAIPTFQPRARAFRSDGVVI